jgi:hypothetical protein
MTRINLIETLKDEQFASSVDDPSITLEDLTRQLLKDGWSVKRDRRSFRTSFWNAPVGTPGRLVKIVFHETVEEGIEGDADSLPTI